MRVVRILQVKMRGRIAIVVRMKRRPRSVIVVRMLRRSQMSTLDFPSSPSLNF